MKYRDLRDFVAQLERKGELRRVSAPVSPALEMTALADRVLRAGGPAIWFAAPTGHTVPVLANLFGTTGRVALGMGAEDVSQLRDIGHLLARLKEPEPPQGLKDAGRLMHLVKAVWDMKPVRRRDGPCREVVLAGDEVDLSRWPVQTCWPGDAAPLITWGLVVTRGPQSRFSRWSTTNCASWRRRKWRRRNPARPCRPPRWSMRLGFGWPVRISSSGAGVHTSLVRRPRPCGAC